MKKSIYLILLILIISITGFSIIYIQDSNIEDKHFSKNSNCDHVKHSYPLVISTEKFNDINTEHLIHAKQNGLKQPFECDSALYAEIDDHLKNSRLIKVTENNYFQIKELTYSHPYLVPEAVDMLNEIGYRFQEAMKVKNQNHFKFQITSLLRTEQTQNKLCRHNRNATKSQSAHIFGTTVDISYKNFYCTKTKQLVYDKVALTTLTKILVEMRKECKFLAVREYKQNCFHLTVVVCQPIPDEK
jgi:uncharacterized protein YcbK (DUF882 family)